MLETTKNAELSQIMEREFWQKVQDAFSRATGLAAVTVDTREAVTEGSGFTRFCMDVMRKNPEGARRCNACDLKGGIQSRESGRCAIYDCHAGLTDLAAPIIVNGELVGSLTAGQILPGALDEQKHTRYAQELGIDPETYLAALRQVKVVPREQIQAAGELMYLIASRMGDFWYQSRSISAISDCIQEDMQTLSASSEQCRTQSEAVQAGHETLSANLDRIDTSVSDILRVLEAITTIARQSKMLGLNASIEAARAGQQGQGFSVVAKEVRALSENSADTARQIGALTTGIQKVLNDIQELGRKLEGRLQAQRSAVDTLQTQCGKVSAYATEIGALAGARRAG